MTRGMRKRAKPILIGLYLLLACGFLVFAGTQGPVILMRHLGQPGGVWVPDVNRALTSADSPRQLAAAQRLAELAPDCQAALPAMQAVLADPQSSNELRWWIAYAVTQMGDEAIELLALASLQPLDIAQERFRQLPPDRQAEVLIQQLEAVHLGRDPDVFDRSDGSDGSAGSFGSDGFEDQAASDAEMAAGQQAQAIVRWLGTLGSNTDGVLQRDRLLGTLNPPVVDGAGMSDEKAVESARAILHAYRQSDFDSVVERALVQLGRPAVGPLIQELQARLDPAQHFGFRTRIYNLFRDLGPLASEAEEVLLEALRAETVNLGLRDALAALVAIEPVDRQRAAETVRQVGEPQRWQARGYAPEYINQWCLEALDKLGDTQTIQWLISEFERGALPGNSTRSAAGQRRDSWREARLLGELGPRAAKAAAVLEQALESPWPEARTDAALALYRVGGSADAAVAALLPFLEMTETDPPDQRGMAAMYLGEIGPAAVEAVPPLLERLVDDPQENNRLMMADALHKIAPDSDEVSEALQLAALKDPSDRVARVAFGLFRQRIAAMEPLEAQSWLPEVSLDLAIEWLREAWAAEAPRPRPMGMEYQIWLAQRELRQGGEPAAVLLADWMLVPSAPSDEVGQLFEELGPHRLAALPRLRQALRSADETVVRRAIRHLASMGELARDAVPDLRRRAGRYWEARAAIQSIAPDHYLADTRSPMQVTLLFGGAVLLVIGPIAYRWRLAKVHDDVGAWENQSSGKKIEA